MLSLTVKKAIFHYIVNPVIPILFRILVAYNFGIKRKFVSGALPNLKDDRDRPFKIGVTGYERKYTELDLQHSWIYCQFPFNDCIFAAGVLALSWMSGLRFSVRWIVKLARKLGYTTRDGWSFQRALLKIVYKVGLVPYDYCPDETGNMSWEEFSRWTEHDQWLLENIAPLYKVAEYMKIDGPDDAYQALDNGYVLFTACKWYRGMNQPRPPDYVLYMQGGFIGGHAFDITGYPKYVMTNSFGENWGNKGKAVLNDIFGPGFYEVYTFSKYDFDTPVKHITTYYEGKTVKMADKPEIYVIQNGLKYHITNPDRLGEYPPFVELTSVEPLALDRVPYGGEHS